MVKSKNLGFFNFCKVLFNFDLYKHSFSKKALLGYNIMMLVILFVLLLILNFSYKAYQFSVSEVFVLSFLGLIGSFLLFHALHYVVSNSYVQEKRRNFFESFLVFLGIVLPFSVLLHLVNILKNYFWSSHVIYSFFSFLFVILVVYFIVNFIFNIGTYYKINFYQSFVVFLLTAGTFVLLGLVYLVTLLVARLEGF